MMIRIDGHNYYTFHENYYLTKYTHVMRLLDNTNLLFFTQYIHTCHSRFIPDVGRGLTIVLAFPPGTVNKAICGLKQYALTKKKLYPWRGSRGISDIPPRRPCSTKIA
jgi:hypothetical protein